MPTMPGSWAKRRQHLRVHPRGPRRHLNPALGVNDYLGLVLKCGETNLKAMELLDAGNTGAYGHPVPTKVPSVKRKARPSSFRPRPQGPGGNLKQSAQGINVYTHGEMPALPRLSGTQQKYRILRPLRHRLAEQPRNSASFRAPSSDHQLHPEAHGHLPGQHLHRRFGGWPGVQHLADGTSTRIDKALALPLQQEMRRKEVMWASPATPS